MVRKGVVMAAVGFALSRDPGCGAGGDPSGGTNAPCTRTKDCSGILVCIEGVCVDPDGGAPGDSGSDARPADAANGG